MRRPATARRSPAPDQLPHVLTLDELDVDRVGVLRASFDAVAAHPAVVESLAAARLEGPAAVTRHSNAAGALARRTAEAAVYTPPPF